MHNQLNWFPDQSDVVATLIECGTDINATDVAGLAPLHIASYYSNQNHFEFISDKLISFCFR